MASIGPAALRDRLARPGELAVLDVREQGAFSRGHLFHACCIPLSHLELRIADLVPLAATPIVVMDGGAEGAAQPVEAARAARRLTDLGYREVAVLAGGVAAWRAEGFEVFSGVNVPSKAFGEFVEATYGTPHISAQELAENRRRGADMVILDSRPWPEYQRMSIPGGIDCPGAELVLAVHDLAPDPATLVVVNCAGRTRSIIGAQSLINAGVANPVVALENGTMGWELAGFELEHGQDRRPPGLSAAGLAKATAAAKAVADRFGVATVDRTTLGQWRAEHDAGDRTLYLLDVRTPEEFTAGHLAGARHAPGGQLVQALDEYVAVRGARLVLADDNRVRATMTAHWLIQLGWDQVYVLTEGTAEAATESGARPWLLRDFQPQPTITAAELKAALDSHEPVAVVDLSDSLTFRAGHVPGAHWCVRARLAGSLVALPPAGLVVLMADDEALAHYGARDLAEAVPEVMVRVLRGGLHDWRAAGFAVAQGLENTLTEVDDIWWKPYDTASDMKQAMRDYLGWEVDLVQQVARDGSAGFKRF